MKNDTTNRPLIQLSDLTFNTTVYRVSKPPVRLFEIDVFDTIGSILNFRPSGLRIAREIIKRQGGEEITIQITDADLAEALWSDLPESTRLSRLVRSKRNLKEDQTDSGFRFIYKVPAEHGKTESGRHFTYPSKYRPGDYWSVSDGLQSRSDEVDFFGLTIHKRRIVEREMLTEILLDDRKYKKIVRQRQTKNTKGATESEASGAVGSLPSEGDGITVARAMYELQRMSRGDQFQFAKDFTETVTSHLIADSQDYDEGAHIFSKIQTSALIGGKHSLDDLRQRIARHNKRGAPASSKMRVEALRASLDEAGAMLAKCEQLAALCDASDAPECADYFKRWAASLKDFRWAITEDRKGKTV